MLRKVLPWAAALGAGAGAYKFLRTPSFSANPLLRKVQQQAASKGFHRIVDVTPDGTGGLFRPVANAEGKLSPWNKLKMFLNEGTTEAIPISHAGDVPKVVGHKGPRRVQGVTHGRHDVFGTSDAVRGGIDIEGPQETMTAMNRVSKGGKKFEANLLNKHAPGSMPETHTDLGQLFEGLPADRQQAVAELQSRVLSNHGENVLLKPNQGLASGGKFPRANQDWSSQLQAYDAHMADPAKRQTWRAAKQVGGNELSKYMIDNGLYEGGVLHQALRNPKSVLAQKLIENPLGEWRAHTMAGSVPANMMFPRFSKGPKAIAGVIHRDKAMQSFLEDTVAKLPPKYQSGNYAFDVMPHRQPDGSIGYKILEMNPTEQATATAAGGGSGFLDPSTVPFTGHSHYRAATGRHTPLVAGLGGVGAASLAGLGTRALTRDEDEQ